MQSGTDAGNHTDGGNEMTDGGALVDCGGTTTMHHHSYVPCGQKPTAATRLIVLGDSISAGYGATDGTGNECSNQCASSYVGLLMANDAALWPLESATTLTALFGSGLQLVSVAHPGDTTRNTATNQLTDLSSNLGASVSGHSIVVITIGGNDMFALSMQMSSSAVDTTINNIISNLRTTIAYLQDPVRFPDGTSIYLANVYDPSDSTGVLPYACLFAGVSGAITNPALETGVGELATRYTQLGQELGFAVIDDLGHIHGHGLTAAMTSDPNYDSSDPVNWFYTDCIHPTNDGHNELRRLFYEAINVGHYVATDI